MRGFDLPPEGGRKLALVLSLTAILSGCGDSSSPSSPSPSENPHRVTISASGIVTPAEITVPQGARVLFINNDSRRHDMTSDPHPDHQDCPPINAVGLLMPGQSRETGNLTAARTCGFHDHENPDNNSLRGRIIIRP